MLKSADVVTIRAVRRSDNRDLISGEHLVRPDGTVQLGIYGNVEVAGLDAAATRAVLTRHLETRGDTFRDVEVRIEPFPYRKVK